MMMKNKSVILLSGGLDSLVCMGVAKENYNISLALTFDYGQKSAKQEIEASKKILSTDMCCTDILLSPLCSKP